MRVELKDDREEENKTVFGDLYYGGAFQYGGNYYVRARDSRIPGRPMAVSVSNGDIIVMEEDMEVTPIDAQLVILRNRSKP